MATSDYHLLRRSTHSFLPFLNPQLTQIHSSFRKARPTTRTPICVFRTPRKCVCSVRWQEWNNLCTTYRWHDRGSVSGGYLQQDNKFHKRHCGGCTDISARQLHSVDAAQAPWTGGHYQEDNLQSARPNHDRVLLSWGNPWFSEITGTSYTQLQVFNIASVIHRKTGKFWLAICKWNHVPEIQKKWVLFKQFFWTSHRDLRETSNLTVEDAVMHHVNMVRNFVAGLQEALQQDQDHTETPTIV